MCGTLTSNPPPSTVYLDLHRKMAINPALIPFIPAAELEALISYLADFVTFRYCTVAATVLYAYDFMLTLEEEVKFVWYSPWTTVKTFFLIVRYFAFGCILTFTTLNVLPLRTTPIGIAIESFAIISVVLLSFVEVILQIRLFALYNNDKRVVIPVMISFVMMVFAQLGMASYEVYFNNLGLAGFDATIAESLGICPGGTPTWFYLFMIPIMVFDFILFVLALYKSLQHYRQVPDKTWSGARVISMMMRDSLLFFMINFVVFLISTLIYLVGPRTLYQKIANWQMVIPAILAERLVLNVRGFYSKMGSTTSTSTSTISMEGSDVIELQHQLP
ncbi:hypothetical protein SERLA73DRAFT_162144 [Serpula lacrymans var. lacrymans S7.3]|uniref:DUF6533 domain-containing protein n=1 Tax=Serpula lacrymans var. lacrymans (strain S7.3) TaxID=936435 RepID=F8Q6N8_SERL3|nr:hypothetical protein SERLA73DRAFT_162144 [Serpula lacrymans var. lacrymans S7.3]